MDKSKRSNNSWSAKQFKKMFEKGKIRFDHPIQRKGGQWDKSSKSLFINSMANGYPIPPFYALKEDGVYWILDGQQRLTTAINFMNNEFVLDEDTPEVDGMNMAECLFDELNEDLKDEIEDCMFNLYSYEDIAYEEIEDIFFRLNSGKQLSNIQKAKATLGVELSEKISVLTNHPIFEEKIKFSENQIKNEEDLKVLMEFFMLYDNDYEMTKAGFTPTEVSKYVAGLRERKETCQEFIDVTKSVLDLLNEVIEEPNKKFLKPTNLPMLFNVANYAIENEVTADKFKSWYSDFLDELKVKEEDEMTRLAKQYKEFGGNGSKKPVKIMGRVNTLVESLDEFINNENE